MNMSRSTIISTNLSLKQLRDSYTDRVTSRIMRYRIIPLYGRDIRVLRGDSLTKCMQRWYKDNNERQVRFWRAVQTGG